jgi:hypothetical protein
MLTEGQRVGWTVDLYTATAARRGTGVTVVVVAIECIRWVMLMTMMLMLRDDP